MEGNLAEGKATHPDDLSRSRRWRKLCTLPNCTFIVRSGAVACAVDALMHVAVNSCSSSSVLARGVFKGSKHYSTVQRRSIRYRNVSPQQVESLSRQVKLRTVSYISLAGKMASTQWAL